MGVLLAAVLLCAASVHASAQGLYGVRGPWLDDQARPYRLDSLAGSYSVFTMAYGACRRVCSTSLRVMEDLHRLAEARHVALEFVVVGLDPSEDKPADWATLRTDMRLNFPNMQFLSGDERSVPRLAAWLGVHYWRYGEHTLHDFRIVLVSPQGKVVRAMNAFDEDATKLLP